MKQMMIQPTASVQAHSEYLRGCRPSVQSMRYCRQADAAALLSQTVRCQREAVGGEAC
jgi:hypothetical protein